MNHSILVLISVLGFAFSVGCSEPKTTPKKSFSSKKVERAKITKKDNSKDLDSERNSSDSDKFQTQILSELYLETDEGDEREPEFEVEPEEVDKLQELEDLDLEKLVEDTILKMGIDEFAALPEDEQVQAVEDYAVLTKNAKVPAGSRDEIIALIKDYLEKNTKKPVAKLECPEGEALKGVDLEKNIAICEPIPQKIVINRTDGNTEVKAPAAPALLNGIDLRLCVDSCGNGYTQVGGWHDTNGISDIAYGPGCGGQLTNRGTDRPLTLLCQKPLQAETVIEDVRLCVDSCGSGYDHFLGGWNDTNDIGDVAYGPGCSGGLEDRGSDHGNTMMCAKKGKGTPITEAKVCVDNCGNGLRAFGGWKDTNDIDDVGFGPGCGDVFKNRGTDARFAYMCLK